MKCPFCTLDNNQILFENDFAFAIYDKFPIQKGHMLIIPRKHVETYFDATSQQIAAIHELIKEGKNKIDFEYGPDGYNIGVNIGYYGGQTVNHLHFHLIPRYKGDIEDPRGGIRKAIPNLVQYP
ncbi:HIT family protein [Bacillus massilinigeriensis]|uniref:HIT family protein n=1 Tax=Bacillus massilionigeriensis TaxID=1805475 RepID=UPI00096B0BA2|nr:HIT family protein [Bacillus massilionigeriensis]